jgi:inosine-uridine nucleoside N-ribohydrolase
MIHSRTSVALAVLALALFPGPSGAQSAARRPVLIDTDVGTDIDDAFAVALALGSYELDVRGLTTVGASTHQKAMLLCRLLTATGRRHLPVAAGADPQPPRPLTDQFKYYHHPDPIFDRTSKPDKQPAAEFLYARLKQQPGDVTLVALGPLTNVARLLDTHADARSLVRRIVLLESNFGLDVPAARKVLASGAPLLVLPASASRGPRLDDAGVRRVFSPATALTRQVETLYQMWDRHHPPLGEALAVALVIDERLAALEKQSVAVDEKGALKGMGDVVNATVAGPVKADEFVKWYVERMAALVPPGRRPSTQLDRDRMPRRVHVAEDFETDIERYWWMSGKAETRLLPPGSRRACRGVLTHDFDDLLMVSREMYTAVIFNPVPGPPMGRRTRLSFRYWLKGTDTIRVQIYSLTNGYHRHLVVKGLPQEQWRHGTVDMTEARRPDGTGGPLGENERIDDIQFYVDAGAEILIDDIVLYDAAGPDETRPFPRRIVFTAGFDTGRKGEHWRGDFDLVADKGCFWRAARSVKHAESGKPWVRLLLRGQRALPEKLHLSMRYRLTGANRLEVVLVNSQTGQRQPAQFGRLETAAWGQASVAFAPLKLSSVDEIHWLLPDGAELLLDDVLLYVPGEEAK